MAAYLDPTGQYWSWSKQAEAAIFWVPSRKLFKTVSKCRTIWTPLAPTKVLSQELHIAKHSKAEYYTHFKSSTNTILKNAGSHWNIPATTRHAGLPPKEATGLPGSNRAVLDADIPTTVPHNARALSTNSGHDWGSALVARSWPRGDFQLPAEKKAGDRGFPKRSWGALRWRLLYLCSFCVAYQYLLY